MLRISEVLIRGSSLACGIRYDSRQWLLHYQHDGHRWQDELTSLTKTRLERPVLLLVQQVHHHHQR